MEQHFIWNRKENWELNGRLDGFAFVGDQLHTTAYHSYYVSFALDTLENEMSWQRLRLPLLGSHERHLQVCLYASDSRLAPTAAKQFLQEKQGVLPADEQLDSILAELPPREAHKLLARIAGVSQDNAEDILLYALQGRYIWFSIALSHYTEEPVQLSSLRLDFPRASFVDYLPPLYQGERDSFMARFLGIFQSIYLDTEEDITRMPARFSPAFTDPDFLAMIASWFAVDEYTIWPEEGLRELLPQLLRLYQFKGTRYALKEVLRLFLGEAPLLLEHFDFRHCEAYTRNLETMQRLYGENDYTYTLLVPAHVLGTQKRFLEMLKVTGRFQPLEMICNPAVLEPKLHLDHHCYLGINTVLSSTDTIVLDDSHALSGMILSDGGSL